MFCLFDLVAISGRGGRVARRQGPLQLCATHTGSDPRHQIDSATLFIIFFIIIIFFFFFALRFGRRKEGSGGVWLELWRIPFPHVPLQSAGSVQVIYLHLPNFSFYLSTYLHSNPSIHLSLY